MWDTMHNTRGHRTWDTEHRTPTATKLPYKMAVKSNTFYMVPLPDLPPATRTIQLPGIRCSGVRGSVLSIQHSVFNHSDITFFCFMKASWFGWVSECPLLRPGSPDYPQQPTLAPRNPIVSVCMCNLWLEWRSDFLIYKLLRAGNTMHCTLKKTEGQLNVFFHINIK